MLAGKLEDSFDFHLAAKTPAQQGVARRAYLRPACPAAIMGREGRIPGGQTTHHIIESGIEDSFGGEARFVRERIK